MITQWFETFFGVVVGDMSLIAISVLVVAIVAAAAAFIIQKIVSQ